MQRPRGTRDFAPDEMAHRNAVAAALRTVMARHGYGEVQTPTFEELELFTAKSGPGIVNELYAFRDKSGRDLTLRPELTAPTMRMVFNEHAFDPKPLKWSYFMSCFRYDRPQAGRYREFWQFGVEQVGSASALAYAELVALADACFRAAGLEARQMSLGDVRVLGALVDALGLSPEGRAQAMRLIDKGDDAGLRALCTGEKAAAGELDRLLSVIEARDMDAARAAAGDLPADATAALDGLDEIMGLLDAFGVDVRLDLGIARGLDYYTGPVFECHCPLLGAESQLLGGGGYDLSGVFGAQPMPTMGFGLGFDRLLVALEAEGKATPPAPGPDLHLASLGAARDHAVRIVSRLREAGHRVDLDLMDRKPGAAAKHADAIRARFFAVIGERDLEAGTVRVKELASGKEHEVPLDGIGDVLARQ